MTFVYCPPQTELDVIFCNDDLVVLNKPSGLLSVPGRNVEHKDCLETRAQLRYSSATTVHRLDMDTSGIMVMALNKEAHRHISKQFENKTLKKSYICLVAGVVGMDAGKIDLPLRCDWPNRPLQMVDHDLGKKALTHWRVLERLDEVSRLELIPVTGRSHQLRVHCLSMGHPILGDRFYAPPEVIAKSKRLCLHAEMLELDLPASGMRKMFKAPCPF